MIQITKDQLLHLVERSYLNGIAAAGMERCAGTPAEFEKSTAYYEMQKILQHDSEPKG